MTGLEGNTCRKISLPREIQDRLPRVSIGRGVDSLLPEGPVIICFIIPLC